MRYAHLFALSATLFSASSAFAGDAWYAADATKSDVVYEEVGKNVYMAKGLLASLKDGDQLLDVIEDTAATAKESGYWTFMHDDLSNTMSPVYCTVYTETWTDDKGVSHTSTLTVCG